MTEEISKNENAEDAGNRRFNIFVGIIIALLAVLGAFITKIEQDAATLSGLASNDEQIYYYQAIGEQISGDAKLNYEFGTVYQLWYQYDMLRTAASQRGDQEETKTYAELSAQTANSSSLLKKPYFNAIVGKLDLLRYKFDTYEQKVIELREMQSAATAVADFWDEKDGTYVLQLTLLAVAGFLLGLALMTRSKMARLIFTSSGIPMTLFIAAWAYYVWVQPVYDLRDTGAIPLFAEGSALVQQRQWHESLKLFDAAIEKAGEDHPYANAYLQRAFAYTKLGDYESAVRDYQVAIDAEVIDPSVTSDLVWALYHTGRFDEALEVSRDALDESPNDITLRSRVGMVLLSSGNIKEARQEFETMLATAQSLSEEQRSLGGNTLELQWQLSEVSFQLVQLADLMQSKSSSPIKDAIAEPLSVRSAALEIASMLREGAVTLEFGKDSSDVSAVLDTPQYAFSLTNEQTDIYKVDVKFKYKGIKQGQVITFKVYRDGIEEIPWGFSQEWKTEEEGVASFTLSPSYADVFVVQAGTYIVEIYINGKSVQRNGFLVERQEDGSILATELASPEFSTLSGNEDTAVNFIDMNDSYDFMLSDLFFFEDENGNIVFINENGEQIQVMIDADGNFVLLDDSGTPIESISELDPSIDFTQDWFIPLDNSPQENIQFCSSENDPNCQISDTPTCDPASPDCSAEASPPDINPDTTGNGDGTSTDTGDDSSSGTDPNSNGDNTSDGSEEATPAP